MPAIFAAASVGDRGRGAGGAPRRVFPGRACHDGGVSEIKRRPGDKHGAGGTEVIGDSASRDEVGIVRPGAQPVQHERPEDWGWHGETGKLGRVGAWITVLILLSYLIGNHEGRVEDLYVVGFAATIAGILIWDIRRRKNAWRSR